MRKRTIFFSVIFSVFILASVAIRFFVKRSGYYLDPEIALQKAKAHFAELGQTSGPWLYLDRDIHYQDGHEIDVYRGAITCEMDGKQKTFDFVIDAIQGNILETTERQS